MRETDATPARVPSPHPLGTMPRARRGRSVAGDNAFFERKTGMWWGIGGGILLYFVLMVVLGVSCLRKGHWVMFILGIFLPIFWLVGAVIPPARPQAA
jgi:hypothetical protein